jgi:hypothetical protein
MGAFLSIVAALCGTTPSPTGTCPCPSYTELAGAGELRVTKIHRGTFSGAGRDEAVVAIGGCESGAASSSTMASRALLRQTASGWKRVAYAPGALGECAPVVSSTGLERLVCRALSGHMGLHRETVSLFGWSDQGEENEELVAYWTTVPPVLTTKRFELRGRELQMDVASPGQLLALRFLFDGTRFTVAPASRAALAVLNRLGAEP